MTGNDLTVNLATNEAGALISTAAQIVAAINANPAASALLKAFTYRGNAGTGVRCAGRARAAPRLAERARRTCSAARSR